MEDLKIRIEGQAGRITLRRPGALNALSSGMAIDIEAALDYWRSKDAVKIILIDAEGDKAFCAGGDIVELYEAGRAQDYAFGRNFWRQEYRLNLKIAQYSKPIVTFMQGFTMGGGVGLGCHAAHRIVCETSKIAMPECSIGLVPDVGGSRILGQAPKGIGVYLGLTGTRMGPGDAIYVGFADHFVPQADWDGLKARLIDSADPRDIKAAVQAQGPGTVAADYEALRPAFDGATVAAIAQTLGDQGTEAAQKALGALGRGAPLSLCCALEMIRGAASKSLAEALVTEFRFVHRSQAQSDFLEGIRAQVIDRDFAPKWRHDGFDVPASDVAAMLAPLDDDWTYEGETP